MVKIDNKIPDQDNDSDNNNDTDSHNETKRYQIDPKELTFPIDGMKNARVVKDSDDIPEGNSEASTLRNASKSSQQKGGDSNSSTSNKEQSEPKDPRIVEYERLQRLSYDERNVKFIHLPDDPAYQPISLEAIKMNEFENEDLKLNTRIMMNIALSDYVIFRLLNEDDTVTPVKVYFRRVKTNEFQEYVDLQTELDDLVKRVGIVESTYPFTLELQDKLYDYQKKLIAVARKRVRKGFDIFFKL